MTRNDAAEQTFAHYLSGTHWDREWYRPFQDYRVVLVELIDALLDLMENNPDFRYFHLDGQTCMLRDYVQVRPENEGRLRELIRSSRLLIGPWFTMPDLFCVGGEALVRNLLMGRRVCSEWGAEPMDVGFVCDMFGHPSQMPQLFAGFGYDRCVLGRGTNEHNTPMYFRWQGPDGSDEGFNTQEVKAFHLEDESGRRVPYQRLGLTVRANERSRYALPCFSSAGPFDRYTVAAEVAWEGMGFTSLRVVPSDKPVRAVGSLRTGPAAAE